MDREFVKRATELVVDCRKGTSLKDEVPFLQLPKWGPGYSDK